MHLLFPEVCYGCSASLHDNEKYLCFTCENLLPIAYDLIESDDKVKELFYGRANVHHARSLFYYEKVGVVQQLIHHLKYKGVEEIGTFIGHMMREKMKNDQDFQDITHVVPVPVHSKRLKKRGYNQVHLFSESIAEAFEVPLVKKALLKTENTINQARLGQVKRSDETRSPYQLVENSIPEGSHVLVTDDVITTGTTLSMCVKELQKIKDCKISIATMAVSV